MIRKKNYFLYYLFWVSSPIIIGSALAWFGISVAKAAYTEVFGREKSYMFEAKDVSFASRGKIQTEKTEKKSNQNDSQKTQSIDRMRYSFVSSATVASAKKGGLARKIEDSLPKKPNVKTTALSFIAADLDSGEILLEKNKDSILPIASVTKLVTALVSLNTVDQNAIIPIPKSAVDTPGTTGNLKIGEKQRVGDLLYPLLLESSNDAAEALATSKDRNGFIESMNKTAREAGAEHTFFLDPSGLSFRNVSTALDLFKISQYVYKKNILIFQITREKSYHKGSHTWVNPTFFLKFDAYLGGKNGYTDEAGRTAVSLFSIPQENGPNRNVAIVILKSKDRIADVSLILNHLSENMRFPELTAPQPEEDNRV